MSSIDLTRRIANPITTLPNPAPSISAVTDLPLAVINQMLVGRDVSLSGKITGCDRLQVDGTVEATLLECSVIDVARPGVFNGTATVDHAEISGRFDGTLTVRKRLLIRESGKVSGTIRYGQLEVACGGQLSGDIGAES